MYNIGLNVVNFFTIPFSFFLVILSILFIQSILVSKTSAHIGKIYFQHPTLFKAMNWWAVFIHEFSHAVTAILTLNKVKEFKVSSNGGHVVHSSNRRGFFQWLAGQFISASPAFVPPIITVVYLQYLGYIDLPNITLKVNSFEPIPIMTFLYLGLIPYILKTVGFLLANLDYSKIENILLLIILTFSFSAAKPSSMDKKKYGIQGDFQSLVERFVKYPGYTILFILLSIIIFWMMLIFNSLFIYVIIFLILLPLLSIFALAYNYLFIRILNLFTDSSLLYSIIVILAFVVVYVCLLNYIEKRYIINIAIIGIFIGMLKVAK